MSAESVMPMFPLSVVLLPGAVLPLHIFEERYRQLMSDLLAGDGALRFAIPPILRGREVGGGDLRAEVATVVMADNIRVAPDGRYTLLAIAVDRVEVVSWLADDPYPKAEIRAVADEAPTSFDISALSTRCIDVARRSGVVIPADQSLPGDPGRALFALGSLAPIADLDRLAMLRTRDVAERAAVLSRAIDDLDAVLKFRES